MAVASGRLSWVGAQAPDSDETRRAVLRERDGPSPTSPARVVVHSHVRAAGQERAAVKFTKMHGIGNDYVYVNGFAEQVENPSKVAEQVADRHFGIGGDGLILILPSETADVRMQMFNADGSEGEMCGNGIRCVAKYAYEHDLARANPLRVETLRGILPIRLTVNGDRVEQATVDMEKPILGLPEVPVDATKVEATEHPDCYRLALPRSGKTYDAVFVSM